MKLTAIAAGLLTALASSTVFAAPYNHLPVTGTDIYTSGSTAINVLLQKYLAKNCDVNSLDSYRVDISTSTSEFLHVCKVSSPTAMGGLTGYVIVHQSATSSSDGVVPVANQTALSYLAQSDIGPNFAAAEVDVPAVTVGSVTINAYKSFYIGSSPGQTLSTSRAPMFGVSDVEPKFFTTPAVFNKLSSPSAYVLVFGVPVSKAARDALQAAQGKPAGNESLVNMPNLARADVAAIFQGKVTDWQNYGVTGGDTTIYIGRRSSGSGTTKNFDIAFINNACGGSTTIVAPNSTAGSSACTGSNRVVQTGTSDDEVACLANFNTAGKKAIGMLSTDYNPASTDGYRFIRVDGYAPSLLNTTEGRYILWGEGTINAVKAGGLGALSGGPLELYNDLVAEVGTPGILAALDPIQTLGAYQTGFMARNTNPGINDLSFPITAAQMLTNPVSLISHAGDSCSFPTSPDGSDPVDPTGTFGFIPQ
jgi:hypothetical protein